MKNKILLHIACVVTSIIAAWLWYLSGFIFIEFLLNVGRSDVAGIVKDILYFILLAIITIILFILVKKVGDAVVHKYIPYYGVGMGISVISFFVLFPLFKYTSWFLLLGVAIIVLFVLWLISGGLKKLKSNNWLKVN